MEEITQLFEFIASFIDGAKDNMDVTIPFKPILKILIAFDQE